jgi:hypothetical protein
VILRAIALSKLAPVLYRIYSRLSAINQKLKHQQYLPDKPEFFKRRKRQEATEKRQDKKF